MKSKLEQLQEEEKKLTDQLDQTKTKQDEIKSRMITGQLHTAGATVQVWATLGIEIGLLYETLTQVRTQVEAELYRINSLGVAKGAA